MPYKLKQKISYPLLTAAIIIFGLAANAQASDCNYLCYDSTKMSDDNFCKSQGGTMIAPTSFDPDTKTLVSNCEGDISKICSMYQKPVCCCGTGKTSDLLGFQSKTSNIPAPQLSIKIDTINLASGTCTEDNTGQKQCQIPWIAQYIEGIYKYGLSIAGILAAIVLMGGGVLWLISAGDASKITQAKELITGSVVGLLILSSSYLILKQINPNLVELQSLTIGNIKRIELAVAESKNNDVAKRYKEAACATDAELTTGVDFYATGYYKPEWKDSDTFRCIVAMQCTCPNGRDSTKNCNKLYGKTYPGYQPCNKFEASVPYCNTQKLEAESTIAGPPCANLPKGTKVCFRGKTYTITDRGGGIKGRRIDIWTGTDLNKAMAVTGIGKLKKGACQ